MSLLEYNNFEAGEGKTSLDTHFAHISHKIVRYVRLGNDLETGEELGQLVQVNSMQLRTYSEYGFWCFATLYAHISLIFWYLSSIFIFINKQKWNLGFCWHYTGIVVIHFRSLLLIFGHSKKLLNIIQCPLYPIQNNL